MHHNFHICLILLFFPFVIHAQINDSADINSNVVLDIGGPAGILSVNLEKNILNFSRRIQLNAIFGIGSFRIVDYEQRINPDLIVPMGLQVLTGSHKHKVIIGLGSTYANIVMLDEIGNKKRRSTLNLYGKIGYRLNHVTGKSYLQLCYVPIIEQINGFRHWAGLSLGFKL